MILRSILRGLTPFLTGGVFGYVLHLSTDTPVPKIAPPQPTVMVLYYRKLFELPLSVRDAEPAIDDGCEGLRPTDVAPADLGPRFQCEE